MSFSKKTYNTIVARAKKTVPGFADAYQLFLERVTIDQNSRSMITNYSRSIAAVALHFGRVPRHYGFLASRNKPRLREHRLQIGISSPKQKTDWKSIVKATMNFDVDQCPHCKTGTMIRILTFDGNGPPKLFLSKQTN